MCDHGFIEILGVPYSLEIESILEPLQLQWIISTNDDCMGSLDAPTSGVKTF